MGKKKLTWDDIKKIAKATGANPDQVRHWKHRKKISDEWQVKMTKATGGVFDIQQFEDVFQGEVR